MMTIMLIRFPLDLSGMKKESMYFFIMDVFHEMYAGS